MAAAPAGNGGRLQQMLQSAVQAVQWTYSLFWQLCPQQGILVWGEGYYNGAIKTRKTVQPMEVTAEEASLQRSQQLRELYDSLSAGESNQQPPVRRPCAALSPEDLTESEWFYLMCVSFSFPPGTGLPGKAYAKRQHVWLTGANEVDSKVFSRAILAKSARIQTVVCMPILDGVVELGTTERVQEDLSFVQHIKTFFMDLHRHHSLAIPLIPSPKPALSEHSTSNPVPSSSHFPSPPPLPSVPEPVQDDDIDNDDNTDSEAETGRNNDTATAPQHGRVEPSHELMQLEMSEDIRLGSPDDASNNLETELNNVIRGMGHSGQRQAESYRGAETSRKWPLMQRQQEQYTLLSSQLQPAPPGAPQLEEMSQEDTHYSQTVSTILHFQSTRWSESSTAANGYLSYSSTSAFSKWSVRSLDHHRHYLHHHHPLDGTSQWLLKYILVTVPLLHTKYGDENNSPKLRESTSVDPTSRFRTKGTPQDELSANHVLAERRRREKLNERFIILRSLVPFVTKMDKASILGDTIEYVKQLRRKIQELEARARQMELDHERLTETTKSGERQIRTSSMFKDQQRSGSTGVTTTVDRVRVGSGGGPVGSDKKKMRVVEASSSGGKTKLVSPPPPSPPPPADMVQVSIIESDALIELHCPYKEGLLLDVMLMLREMRVEATAVQSSLNNGFFIAELRAKVKENINGKKASIVEVKRALNQIVPHTDL